jgi:hypothetical protein
MKTIMATAANVKKFWNGKKFLKIQKNLKNNFFN